MKRSSTTLPWLLAAVLGGGALQGCKTPPPPPPPPPPVVEKVDAKVQGLQTMGFVRNDDGWELSLGVKLLFDTDKDVLFEAGRASIDEISRTLRKLGIERVRVEGHTDNVGSAAYNRTLSLRRAESVASELVKSGWSNAAIERRGYGSEKPVADNSTAEGRAQNRRVVITVPAN